MKINTNLEIDSIIGVYMDYKPLNQKNKQY